MSFRQMTEALQRFGLGLPGTREDHPWGELVLKVKDKVFVFLGQPGAELCFSVKLPKSGVRVLDHDWAEPTGYGLGKSGWVTIRATEAHTTDQLCAWLLESYRAVAPKTLLKELDANTPASAPRPATKRAAAKKPARPARKA